MGIVEHVGILQSRLYHMESIKEFPRGILDQVISLINPDGENESVHPGPGLDRDWETSG